MSAAAVSLLLAGCATLPLPESHTRKNTFEIVHALRCEVAYGVYRAMKEAGLKETDLALLEVGFDFEFDVTEKDRGKNGLLEFTHAITGGALKLEFGGGLELERQNIRSFRVLETFKQITDTIRIAEQKGEKRCTLVDAQKFLHPVTGRVGLDEIVVTFVRLKALAALREVDKEKDTLMSDKITFTTTVGAGLKPSITVAAAAGPGLKPTKAAFDAVGMDRIDKHTVTIVISPAPIIKPVVVRVRNVTRIEKNGKVVSVPVRSPQTFIVDRSQSRVRDELNRLKRQSDDKRILLETLRLIR